MEKAVSQIQTNDIPEDQESFTAPCILEKTPKIDKKRAENSLNIDIRMRIINTNTAVYGNIFFNNYTNDILFEQSGVKFGERFRV